MKRYIGIAILMLACAAAHAEQLYVIDKLVVGVYPEADSETGKLANLETGDAVEMLERADRHVRVRLSDGAEGWVRASYLTAQPPAILRLKELQASGATPAAPSPQLTQELAQLKTQNAALLKEVDALKEAAASKSAEPAPAQLPTEPEPAREHYDPPESSSHWLWLIAVILTGGLGYLFGYQTFARRVRRKYGSVRII